MAEKQTLLLVDDEVDLLAELKPLLERSGFHVITAIDGEQALKLITDKRPDLVVMDVLMPHVDGREALRRLRADDNWTPVILLTQVGTPMERAMSLQEGADDYINKPFDPFELVARIQAVLRRTQRGTQSLFSFQRLESESLLIDRQTRQAFIDDKDLSLTARAFGVLEHLMLHPGDVITRERLLDEVWGWSQAVETRAVDIRIAELRKALGRLNLIETVVGQGYRFLGQVRGRA